jgi:hypothetical protein
MNYNRSRQQLQPVNHSSECSSAMSRYDRPRAYEDDVYQWHLGRVPGAPADNPALTSAIFLVHGMGDQLRAETAVALHSGFEDALDELGRANNSKRIDPEQTPPPFIHEGYWANYDDVKETFPRDWKKLEQKQQQFFSSLWQERSSSTWRTLRWFFTQQLKLLHPRLLLRAPHVWLIYLALQIVVPTVLGFLSLFFPRVVARVLGDVRLYISPRGIIERAIVQRIDQRVGESFLQMLGLDWEFYPLADDQKIQRNNKGVEFSRIIWVAHSLGTVISYNVLSDLFTRANVIEADPDASKKQKKGVEKFRSSLRRFITLGSPLDKIAYLFGGSALRPWPKECIQKFFRDGPHNITKPGRSAKDWWVNFYHVLDPVSGSLSNELICVDGPPKNYHIKLWAIPGLAHIKYWKDSLTLKYLLSRVYGREHLQYDSPIPYSGTTLSLYALVGFLVWSGIIIVLILSPLVSYVLWPFIVYVSSDWRLIFDGLRHFFLPYF